jgi:hypothetical protein
MKAQHKGLEIKCRLCKTNLTLQRAQKSETSYKMIKAQDL